MESDRRTVRRILPGTRETLYPPYMDMVEQIEWSGRQAIAARTDIAADAMPDPLVTTLEMKAGELIARRFAVFKGASLKGDVAVLSDAIRNGFLNDEKMCIYTPEQADAIARDALQVMSLITEQQIPSHPKAHAR